MISLIWRSCLIGMYLRYNRSCRNILLIRGLRLGLLKRIWRGLLKKLRRLRELLIKSWLLSLTLRDSKISFATQLQDLLLGLAFHFPFSIQPLVSKFSQSKWPLTTTPLHRTQTCQLSSSNPTKPSSTSASVSPELSLPTLSSRRSTTFPFYSVAIS